MCGIQREADLYVLFFVSTRISIQDDEENRYRSDISMENSSRETGEQTVIRIYRVDRVDPEVYSWFFVVGRTQVCYCKLDGCRFDYYAAERNIYYYHFLIISNR